MEKLFYEVRPYVFFAGGLTAIVLHVDRLMLFCGFMLIMASTHIIRSRLKYRAWLAA